MGHATSHPGPFRVMLSSTFKDLKDHREVILSAMPSFDLLPVAMEHDAALPADDLISASLKKVEQSDAYVGLIGYVYGQTPICPARNPQKLSLTELEFRRATELNKPICMFLMSPEHSVPARQAHATKRNTTKWEAFRKLAMKDRIYAEFESVEDLRVKAGLSLRKLHELLGAPTSDIAPAPDDPIRKAPEFYAVTDYIPGHSFIGRTKELLSLDDWAKTDQPVLLFEAIGGMGKSMLTWHWVRSAAMRARSDWAGRFWYSFYERGADMGDFCAYALAYTTGRPLKDFRGRKTAALTPELIDALHAKPWLFVLDGLERVLVAYNRYDAAQAADEDVVHDPDRAGRHPEACIRPADEELLRLLSGAQPSKVLVTSRLMPRALLNRGGQPLPGVQHIDLQGLDPADAERLMVAAGARGDSARMQQYIQRHFGGHPLVVGVVAGLVARYRPSPGDFDKWVEDSQGGADVDLASMDLSQRRNHILKAAFDDLKPEERVLMVRLGLISDSVDFETIEALNPYRPEPPEKVEEPEPPDKRSNLTLRRLAKRLRHADGDERRPFQEKIEKRQADETAKYERQRVAHQEYLQLLEHWERSSELQTAPERIRKALDDLETRGLLNWDRGNNQYDLHPVVRNYAVHCVLTAEMEQIGRKVVDHFSSRSDPPYDDAETMTDVRNGLQVVRSLLQIGDLQRAYGILDGEITNALFYNLERYNDYLALLRPYFPDGWATQPRGLESKVTLGHVAGRAASVLAQVGRTTEALTTDQHAILAAVCEQRPSTLGVWLRNHCTHQIYANRMKAAERVLLIEEELAPFDSDKGHLREAVEQRIYYSLAIGKVSNAAVALETFNSYARSKHRGTYLPGLAESYLAWLRFRQDRLDEEILSDALRTAREGKNRWSVRHLHLLRGVWLLSVDRFPESEAAFEEAIAMARESGLPTKAEEAQRAIAQTKQGKIDHARETAERLALLEDPPEISLAELFLALGDREKALDHVKRGYKWAWADGMPYVSWWELQRCRTVLQALGEPEPHLPFDPSNATPLPFEAEVRAFIGELKAKKEAADGAEKSNPVRPS